MKFDFVAGGQEIEVFILVKIEFFSRYFVFLIHISFRSSLLVIFSSNFKTIKLASSKLVAIIIKTRYLIQPGLSVRSNTT